MARYVRLRLEVEKVSASTAVECGSAVLEPSGIVHRRNNKGYEATHVTEEAELCEIVCDDPVVTPPQPVRAVWCW